MQRGRLLILFGLLLLLLTGGLALLFILRTGQPAPESTPGAEATATGEVDITQIVIAVQPLPRGNQIPREAVALAPWPTSSLPSTAITDVEQVIGKLARYDIERGEPILSTLIAEDPSKLSATGSEAALRIPKGQVAITIPMTRLTGVGYALREGDHVNVLASLLFVDVNETTQSILPGSASLFTAVKQDPTTGETTFTLELVGPEGTVEFSEGQVSIPFFLQPSEPQRPRLVVQQIVQDAIVLNVGNFTDEDVIIAQATPTPLPEGTPPPPPTPIPPPDIVTLIVPPQESLVLNYFLAARARLTLALRSAGDTARVDTDSVTLQYAVERYRISVPTPLNFALEPAVRDLHPPILQNEPNPTIIPLPDGKYICAGVNCPEPSRPLPNTSWWDTTGGQQP